MPGSRTRKVRGVGSPEESQGREVQNTTGGSAPAKVCTLQALSGPHRLKGSHGASKAVQREAISWSSPMTWPWNCGRVNREVQTVNWEVSWHRLHWSFWISLQWIFSFFSRFSVEFSTKIIPKSAEKCPISGRRKIRPRGSTGVERYGRIPRSAANNLGEIFWKMGAPNPLFYTVSLRREHRGRVNREVQTVNWEAGKKGAVETGVKSGLKKAYKPWIRGKRGAQTVN